MKQKQVTVNFYEPGDVLDISEVIPRYQKPMLKEAKRVVIISSTERLNGLITYRALSNFGNVGRITAEELGKEKYIGHIDLSLLTEEAVM